MPELLPNQDKLNRKCKKFLQELKVQIFPDQLYCLQLMLWALDSGKLRATDSRLRSNLEELLGANQIKAYRWLRTSEDGELYPLVTSEDLEKLKEPEDLAWELLDCLDSKLNLLLKDYPSVRL